MRPCHGAVLVSVMLTALPADAADRDPASNLVRNGSLEEGVTGWSAGAEGGATTATLDADAGRKAALRLSADGGSRSWISDPVQIENREPYFLEAFVRTEGVAEAHLDIVESDGQVELERRLGTAPEQLAGTHPWTRVQYVVTPNMWSRSTKSARIALVVTGPEGERGAAWFSDVFFAQGIDLDHIDATGWQRAPDYEKLSGMYRRRHVILYAPMEEEGLAARYAEGEWEPLWAEGYRLVDGKAGRAVQFEKTGGRVAYSGPQNFHQSRGTIAFWMRNGSGSEHQVTVSPTDSTFYGHMLRIQESGDGGPMQIFMTSPDGSRHGQKGAEVAPPPVGEWHHVGFTWDQRFGVKYYVDGEVKYSTWGNDAWAYNALPAGIHVGHPFAPYDNKNLRGSAYDEFYVFDVALTAAELRALMMDELREVRGGPGVAEQAAGALQVAKQAGLTPSASLPVVAADGRTVLKVVHPADVARFGGKGKMRSTDGDVSTYLTDAHDLLYDTPVRVTHLSMVGRGRGIEAHAWSGEEFKAGDLVASVPAASSATFTVATEHPASVEKLRLMMGEGGHISEVRAIDAAATFTPGRRTVRHPLRGPRRIEDFDRLGRPPVIHYNMFNASHLNARVPLEEFDRLGRPPVIHYNMFNASHLNARVPYSYAWEIATQFPRGGSTVLAPDVGYSTAEALVAPMMPLSLFSDVLANDLPLRALTIDLSLTEAKLPDVWRVTIEDPADQRRPVFQFPLTIAGGERQSGSTRVRFTVDIRDLMVPAGERLWVKIESRNGMSVKTDGSSALLLHVGEKQDVMREYLADRLRLCRYIYSFGAERHFWDGASKNPSRPRRPYVACTHQKVYAHLKDFRRHKRDDDIAETLWGRIMLAPRQAKIELAESEDAPAWAVYQCEVVRRASEIANWWIDNKQNKTTGEMGGGFGDDVEMTVRSWPYLHLMTGDPKIARGLQILADGIWNSPEITDGYSTAARDVEHSSEPTSFSQPHMMATLYGHPEYVERNMRTIKHMEWWTAYDAKGKRRMRGWAVGHSSINDSIDAPCNGRALIPGLWVGWYNRHPLVMKWMTEYADAWYSSASEESKGKPKWAIPHEIVAKTGEIYGISGRHPESVYGGYMHEILNILLGVSQLTNNDDLLKPFTVEGRRDGFIAQLVRAQPDGPWIEMCRRGEITNDLAACVAWRAGDAADEMAQRLQDHVQWYANNMYLMTTAEPSTDRVYAPGVDLASCMALGYYPGVRNAYPQIVCSWEGTGYQTGVLIADDSPKDLRVLLYSFRDQPADIVLRTWQLDPGHYALRLGPDANADRRMDNAEVTDEVLVEERRFSPVRFTLPPKRLVVLELKQIEALPEAGFDLLDLAISSDDVRVDAATGVVTVRAHNVGVKAAGSFEVCLQDGDGRTLAMARAEGLDWPSDLLPRTIEVKLTAKTPIPDGALVVIDPQHRIAEITRANNAAPAV